MNEKAFFILYHVTKPPFRIDTLSCPKARNIQYAKIEKKKKKN